MMSPNRLEVISKLVIDLGKVLFGASVIGFFVPGFSGNVSAPTFIAGAIFSSFLFAIGIGLTKD